MKGYQDNLKSISNLGIKRDIKVLIIWKKLGSLKNFDNRKK